MTKNNKTNSLMSIGIIIIVILLALHIKRIFYQDYTKTFRQAESAAKKISKMNNHEKCIRTALSYYKSRSKRVKNILYSKKFLRTCLEHIDYKKNTLNKTQVCKVNRKIFIIQRCNKGRKTADPICINVMDELLLFCNKKPFNK